MMPPYSNLPSPLASAKFPRWAQRGVPASLLPARSEAQGVRAYIAGMKSDLTGVTTSLSSPVVATVMGPGAPANMTALTAVAQLKQDLTRKLMSPAYVAQTAIRDMSGIPPYLTRNSKTQFPK